MIGIKIKALAKRVPVSDFDSPTVSKLSRTIALGTKPIHPNTVNKIPAVFPGIDFLAVTYGFGFKDQKSLKDYNVAMVAENAYDIPKLLCEKETVKN